MGREERQQTPQARDGGRPQARPGRPVAQCGAGSGAVRGGRHIPWPDRLAALRAAFPQTIPVLAGYLFLGITYGMLMTTAGFPVWLPVVTALVVYTGSLEFLLVQILASPFNPVSTLVTALIVGARHLFYGISMLGKYRDMGAKKPYLIYTTSDETFSVNYAAQVPAGIDRGWFYFWVSFLDQLYWVAGSGIGAGFGSLITVDLTGLDFVMTTMFAAIFLQQWFADGTAVRGLVADHISELVGLAGSAACLAVFGPNDFIVPSMVVILAVLLAARKTPQMQRLAARDAAREAARDAARDAARGEAPGEARDAAPGEARVKAGTTEAGRSAVAAQRANGEKVSEHEDD